MAQSRWSFTLVIKRRNCENGMTFSRFPEKYLMEFWLEFSKKMKHDSVQIQELVVKTEEVARSLLYICGAFETLETPYTVR